MNEPSYARRLGVGEAFDLPGLQAAREAVGRAMSPLELPHVQCAASDLRDLLAPCRAPLADVWTRPSNPTNAIPVTINETRPCRKNL